MEIFKDNFNEVKLWFLKLARQLRPIVQCDVKLNQEEDQHGDWFVVTFRDEKNEGQVTFPIVWAEDEEDNSVKVLIRNEIRKWKK